MNQHTLQSSVSLSGTGLHTGKEVIVKLCPAAPDSGVIFRRVDFSPAVEMPAVATLVSSTARGTTLEHGRAKVATCEHLLSAVHALGVDNLVIELNGDEVPILTGSAQPWVEAIRQVGLAEQDSPRNVKRVNQTLEFKTGGSLFRVEPSDHFSVHCIIDFHSSVLGRQEFLLDGFSQYEDQIAPCRTFVFLREIQPLLMLGLIKGGSLDNALVFADKPLSNLTAKRLARRYHCDPSQITVKDGVLNTVVPVFPDEPARHKLLDFIGDIFLVGGPVHGRFTIQYPGHKANTTFAKELINKKYIL